MKTLAYYHNHNEDLQKYVLLTVPLVKSFEIASVICISPLEPLPVSFKLENIVDDSLSRPTTEQLEETLSLQGFSTMKSFFLFDYILTLS